MFGYVRPPVGLLPPEEIERFRRMYCGMCHTLGRRCGSHARLILNYDFTFLAILLSDGDEDIKTGRCVIHPVHGREYYYNNYNQAGDLNLKNLKNLKSSGMDLAADESVILAWRQLWDGVDDNGLLKGLKYRGGIGLLKHAYEKAAAARPEFDKAVRERLRELRSLELARCKSLDRPADQFALLLASAADEIENQARRRVLEQIFYHLGRWIYLIDAADDLKRDAKTGDYNPVALRFDLKNGVWTPEARREFANTLDHSIHRMATAFELWDFGPWNKILSAVIYQGLFQIGRAVLDGDFYKYKNIKI